MINDDNHNLLLDESSNQMNILCGPINCIIFLGVHVFNLSNTVIRLIVALQAICGNIIDSVIEQYISNRVIKSLTPSKISNLIELLESMYGFFIIFKSYL